MTISFAQSTDLTCPNCSRSFAAEIWLIVDTGERPDLVERIRAGSLHDLACTHCGEPLGQADAPLLIFRAHAQPALLFSPAQQTSNEQDQEHAAGLVNLLRERLGSRWQDEWLAQGLAGAPRPMLPAVLSDDPEAALRQIAEQATAELERLRREDPEAFARLEEAARAAGAEENGEGEEKGEEEAIGLALTIQQFIQAQTWDESQRIVGQHPELLSEEAGALLGQLIEAAQAQGDENAVRIFAEHRDLLRRCREAGAPRAFAEKMLPPELLAQAEAAGLAPEELLAMQRAAAEMPPELRAVLAELAATGVEIRSAEDLEAALAARPELRAKLEAAMQSEGGGVDVPVEFDHDWDKANDAEQRYRSTGDQRALDDAVAAWERILNHPHFLQAGERFQLATLNNAGGVFLRRYWARGRLDDLDRALTSWQTAVARTPEGSPDLPSILNNLALGLRARYARTGDLRDLEGAIGHWERAVALTPEGSPDLPSRLNNLALGLRARYARTGDLRDLEGAIGHWQSALNRLHAIVRTGLETRALAGQAAGINRRLLAAHVQAGDVAAALAAAENGRAVRLRLDLARSDRIPAGLSPAEQTEYATLAQETHQIPSLRRGLAAQGLTPAEHAARTAGLGQRFAQVAARLDALEARDPDFLFRPLDYTAMAALARRHNLALVFLQPADDASLGALTFIVHPASPPAAPAAEDMIRLAGLSRDDLHDLLFALPPGLAWDPKSLISHLPSPISPGQIGWLAAYWLTHMARRSPREPQAQALWREVMPRVLAELGKRLAPLAARLHQLGVRRLAIIPGDRLGLLPLHAAAVNAAGETFGDRFELSYAPSATALARCLERATGRERSAPTLAAVANPDGSLVFADDEVRAIASRFAGRAQVAFGPQASRAWLLDHAPTADFLELSTHGSFDPGQPEHSALLLAHRHGYTAPLWLADLALQRQPLSRLQADCEQLTLDDIWAGRLPLRPGCVVTADACETGQIEPGEEAEESLGFPAAFLTAGAASVIASLWAVDDFSTALLMDRVYELMLEQRLRPSAALPQAAAWLRALSLAEVLARLDARIHALQAEKAGGDWASLPLAERAQRRHLLSGMEYRRATLAEAGVDPPFAHPVWWAAFAAYGA